MASLEMNSNQALPTRRVLRLLAAGAIILCSGIAIGLGAGVRWVRQVDPLAFMEPDKATGRLADMVARHLGLSGTQRDQLLAIFESKRSRIDQARVKIYPEIQEILDEVRHEVSALLTPEQDRLWNERFEQMRDRWRPRSATPASPQG